MRLFVAADIEDQQRDRLALQRDCSAHRGWRWLPAENLHLTLAFLGDLPDPNPVLESLARLRHPPVQLEVGPLRMFSRRVLALEVAGLDSLAAEVHRLLGELHTETRPFRGHLTLARAKRGAVPFPPREVKFGLDSSSVSLQQSLLSPDGARYQTLGRFQLNS